MLWVNLLIFAVFVNGFFLIPAISGIESRPTSEISQNVEVLANGYPESMRFELLHRHGPELTRRRTRTRLQHVKKLLKSDYLRQQMISEMLWRKNGTEISRKKSFSLPIFSGAFAGTGQYFVRFRVGTPSQQFLLVADTGSDLTWVNCRYSQNSSHTRQNHRRIFNAVSSSSFSPIPCSSDTCVTELPFSLTVCPVPNNPCRYDYMYADGSSAQGFYANESATVSLGSGKKIKLAGILVGCSSGFKGSSFRAADGVLGLGQSRHSFAVNAALKFGGKFSYCLVDHLSPKNVSNYIVFGVAGKQSQMRYTKLVLDPLLQPFYAVEVVGISIGDKLLEIPTMVWELSQKGGVILDSGTSLTVLVEPAYRAVTSALSESLKFLERVKNPPLEFCFNASGFAWRMVPRMVVHLSGGARLEPPVKSYLIDVAKGVKCLGFLPATWPGTSTIGNILQQNFRLEFDLANGRLGFEPSTCASPP